MTRPALAFALLLAGCTSSHTAGVQGSTGGPPPRVEAVSGGYEVRLDNSNGPQTVTLATTPEKAWQPLLNAFQKLGIPVSTMDTGQRTAGNTSLQVRRQLGGQPLSRYFECGTNLTGNIANNYRLEISVISRLDPDGQGGTRLQTRVTGLARSPEGASSNPVNCGTTGRLESDLANLVKLGAAG